MTRPAPQPSPTPASEPIEVLIGEATAAAAAALAQALQEHWAKGLTLKTKMNGGEWIAQLYKLQQATREELADFESIERVHGQRALRARCNGHGYPAGGDVLVDEVLKILEQVTQMMRPPRIDPYVRPDAF